MGSVQCTVQYTSLTLFTEILGWAIMAAVLDISTLSRPTAQYFYNKEKVYAIIHQLQVKSSKCYYLMQIKLRKRSKLSTCVEVACRRIIRLAITLSACLTFRHVFVVRINIATCPKIKKSFVNLFQTTEKKKLAFKTKEPEI
jgi:hypothetical protein